MADTPKDNDECFIVSPIGPPDSEIRKRADRVRDHIITPAAERNGLRVQRADAILAPGTITTQIVERIITAKAVVADLTDLNPNVFYELAIRDSFRMAVVLIAEDGTNLPFDLIQQRTIFFDHRDLESAHVAKQNLGDALEAALKDPGRASPVLVAANRVALASSDDPASAVLSGLRDDVTRIGNLIAAGGLSQPSGGGANMHVSARLQRRLTGPLSALEVEDLEAFLLRSIANPADDYLLEVSDKTGAEEVTLYDHPTLMQAAVEELARRVTR